MSPTAEPAPESPTEVIAKTLAKKKTTKKKKAPAKKDKTAASLAISVIKTKLKRDPVRLSLGQRPHVPSGSFAIDDLIGGNLAANGKDQICPGYPCGRLIELYGPEASGKTTAALHAVAKVQKAGGGVLYLDYEHCLDRKYAESLGVSFREDRMAYMQPDTLEEGIEMMHISLVAGIHLIVIDSVAAMVPREEMEADVQKEGRFGALARVLGRNLPKMVNWIDSAKFRQRNRNGCPVLMLNQTRADIGSKTKGAVKTPGGYALRFYCSIRLQFSPQRLEYVKRKDSLTGKEVSIPFGSHTRVKVIKNKIDLKNGMTHDIFIRYGEGIDDHYSMIAAGLFYKVFRRDGSWYTYNKQRFNGREALRKFLQETPKAFDAIRAEILKRLSFSPHVVAEKLTEEELIAKEYDDEFGGGGDDDDEDGGFDPFDPDDDDAGVEEEEVEDPEGEDSDDD